MQFNIVGNDANIVGSVGPGPTIDMDNVINRKIASTMVGPTVLIAAGLIPATAIFLPLGVALYKICTHTPR